MSPSFLKTALLLTLGAAAMAAQAGAADVQKTLQADYAARDAAFMQRNIDSTLAHYAPDFTSVGASGKTHDLNDERADFLHTFALPAKSLVTKSTIDKLTLSKDGKIATVALHKHGILLFVNSQTGRNEVLVLDGTVQDVWTKRDQRWALAHEQASAIQATMNGKPL